jgi:hypothetical protein
MAQTLQIHALLHNKNDYLHNTGVQVLEVAKIDDGGNGWLCQRSLYLSVCISGEYGRLARVEMIVRMVIEPPTR